MSTLKVDGIRSNSASSDAITLASDGTCTANITNRTNKNLVVNGACLIAQRGTAATQSEDCATVDRFAFNKSGTNETPTQAQVDVASGTTPYTLGFRKAFQITNGNQTGGAGTSDFIRMRYAFEAQDIANSGWNYTSSSSFITLSFWVKSSVAQSFHVNMRAKDGSDNNYTFETGSLSANTWTKITKTISGNSNLTFDNNTDEGLYIHFHMFRGTGNTGTVSQDQWVSYDSALLTQDQTSTWYTTNDATFELTGVQLEVSDHATDFEHRSYADELLRCKRYYVEMGRSTSGETGYVLNGLQAYATTALFGVLAQLPVTMRAKPTCTTVGSIKFSNAAGSNVYAPSSTLTANQTSTNYIGTSGTAFSSSLFTQGGFAVTYVTPDGTNYIKVDAEL